MTTPQDFPPRPIGFARLALRLLVILLVVAAVLTLMDWAIARAEKVGNMPLMIGILAAILLSYALLLAVPFVPGIEIGISLLVLRGAEVAPFVYAATVLGLSFAFLAGRFMPYRWLHAIFVDLRMKRACQLIERIEPLERDERLSQLTDKVPPWLSPFIGSGRYIVLGILLNVPGNALLGGGGGIAFAAGFSRLFKSSVAIAVIALAVLPVPLAVWLYGAEVLR